MSQIVQVSPQNKDFIEGIILMNTYTKGDKRYIAIGNHRLDFKHEYEYLGLTKKGDRVKVSSPFENDKKGFLKILLDEYHQIQKPMFYTIKLVSSGYNYIERMEGMDL